MNLILASSSPYRLQLLRDAGLTPAIIKPQVDESKVKSEMSGQSPLTIAQKLAFLKCEQVVKSNELKTPFIVIGSDQVCVFEGQIFDKPGDFQNNFDHLKKLQNNKHSLITCVCLMAKSKSGKLEKFEYFNQTDLQMKPLSDAQITEYLNLDQPFDCAGGYKFESRGRDLIAEVISEDETAIQGLPMIQTMKILKELGV